VETDGATGQSDPYNEECQNHNGEWEPSSDGEREPSSGD
jgi:hypothetical protein